jgi:hypothetical protein
MVDDHHIVDLGGSTSSYRADEQNHAAATGRGAIAY